MLFTLDAADATTLATLVASVVATVLGVTVVALGFQTPVALAKWAGRSIKRAVFGR
jgi:hypothetical protein